MIRRDREPGDVLVPGASLMQFVFQKPNLIPFLTALENVQIALEINDIPAGLLADEPTASLDGALGRQVIELFATIAHERHAGVLVVSHDSRTLELFDRILDVEDGVIRTRTNQKESRPRSTA